MDRETVKILSELNGRFYAQNAKSFSQTRERPWTGWERVAERLSELAGVRGALKLLDVACGNMRFEKYLAQEGVPISEEVAVDSCPELFDEEIQSQFVNCDIVDALLSGRNLRGMCGFGPFDVVVCFGFMHHVPSFELRKQLLYELSSCVDSGGLVIISFWQFMNDARIAAKARPCASELEGHFEANDYLLGWQDSPDAVRFCHHFDDEEISALLATLPEETSVMERYCSDGRSIPLNAYIILQRTGCTEKRF